MGNVFIMRDLFNDTAKCVSSKMNIEYSNIEADNSLKFLKDVSLLSRDAKEVY